MSLKTSAALIASGLLLAACSGPGPSESEVEKHVRAGWNKQITMLSFFGGQDRNMDKLRDGIKRVKLEQCEQLKEDVVKCNVSLKLKIDDETHWQKIRPVFRKSGDQWRPHGDVLTDR